MFVLTLYFYSPRAYEYIREKFDQHLPAKRTIQKWYENVKSNGKKGFCEQSIEVLTQNVEKVKAGGIEPVCSLIFDEMAIRKNLQWSAAHKQFQGQITYGFRPDCTEVPLANNALVFMMSGINFDLSIPLAYYFINSLTAAEKVKLLTEVISVISELGVRVISITFDGLASNATMCKQLGANFKMNNLKPYFELPGDDRKIYVIIDPSHVLKLARNILGNKNVLVDDAGLEVQWNYFIYLEKLRVEKDFSRLHNLTKKHIEYTKCKMNVRIAAETLSNSVANSMQHLLDKGYDQFSKSSATIKFIRFINDVFDIMNTKDINRGNEFKNAINPTNKVKIFTFFDELTDYLKKIKLPDGNLVINSKNRTAFRGFIINMANFKSIYEELVESNLLNCLPTFKFSQDHLESFFGRIRSLPGCNDNPTTEQFIAGFKKIVVCNEIKCSEKSNCGDHLNLTVLSVSSRRSHSTKVSIANDFSSDTTDLERSNMILQNYESNDLLKMSIAWDAATIEDQIEKLGRFECGDCYDLFSDNDQIDELPESFASKFARLPRKSTFDICNTAHKYVQNLALDANYTYEAAKKDILHEYSSETAYPKTNFAGHEEHKYFIIEFITTKYIDMQATYIAKRVTLKEQKLLLRNKLRKIIHFAGG